MCASFFADGVRHLPTRSIVRTPRAPHAPHAPRALASRCAAREPLRLPRRAVVRPASSGLGAASAGPIHAWALPLPLPLPLPMPLPAPVPAAPVQAQAMLPRGASVVRIPLELIQAMRRTAAIEGRDEATAWAEAAREWLASRARDDEPQPPTPAAAALPCPRAASAWAAIDAVLADLCAPCPTGRAA